MANLLDTEDFRISIVGNSSGETYVGDFSCLRRLSHRAELARDRMYRDLLGPNAQDASDRAKSQAELISDCASVLVKTPTWWKESNNGLDLVDDNVLAAIWEQTVNVRLKAVEETKKRAENAHDKLKKSLESDPEGKNKEE